MQTDIPAHEARLEHNKGVVRRFYAEAINGRRLTAVDELLTVDFVRNGDRRGATAYRDDVAALLAGFSDLRHDIRLLVAERNLVAAHQIWTGIHDGEFAGLAPTGRSVSFTSTAVLRIDGERIAEAWDQVDLTGLMTQIRGGGA